VNDTTLGRARPKATHAFGRLTFAALAFLLLLDLLQSIFGGVLRYYLAQSGIPSAAYAPKFLIIVMIVVTAILSLQTLRVRKSVITITVTFVVYLLVGLIYTKTATQVLFGAFILVQLYFGVLIAPVLLKYSTKLTKYALVMWLCVAAGVTFNHFSSVSWSGSDFTIGTHTLDASRQWSAFGINRIAGFSRASYSAASQLLFLALVVLVLGKRTLLRVFVWLCTGVLVVATTTKTAIGVFLIITVLAMIIKMRRLFPQFVRATMFVAPIVICLIGIIAPVSILLFNFQLDLSSVWSELLFASFGDRLQNTWPDTFNLIFNHGNWLLGRGIGGIGAAQQFFEPTLFSPADNMFLYLYASFGIVALYILFAYTRRVCSFHDSRQKWDVLMWLMGVAVLAEGWTINVVESSFLALALGITFAASTSKRTDLA